MNVRLGVDEADAGGAALQEPEVAVAPRVHERRDGPTVAPTMTFPSTASGAIVT